VSHCVSILPFEQINELFCCCFAHLFPLPPLLINLKFIINYLFLVWRSLSKTRSARLPKLLSMQLSILLKKDEKQMIKFLNEDGNFGFGIFFWKNLFRVCSVFFFRAFFIEIIFMISNTRGVILQGLCVYICRNYRSKMNE